MVRGYRAGDGCVVRDGRVPGARGGELLAYVTTDGASSGPTEAGNLLIAAIPTPDTDSATRNYRLRQVRTHGTPTCDRDASRIRGSRLRFVA